MFSVHGICKGPKIGVMNTSGMNVWGGGCGESWWLEFWDPGR